MSTLNDHDEKDYKQIIIDNIKNGTRTARIAKELGLTKSYVDQVYFEYLRQPIAIESLTGKETKGEILATGTNNSQDLTSV